MRSFAVALMLMASSAIAQQSDGPFRAKDLLTQSVHPAPENGNIIVQFGETTRIYFTKALKSIRLDDDLLVKAVPESNHVVAFTGAAPGQSTVIIESTDGKQETWGLVFVVRDLHEVRIYRPAHRNTHTGELSQDSTDNQGGYIAVHCNEIRCDEQ